MKVQGTVISHCYDKEEGKSQSENESAVHTSEKSQAAGLERSTQDSNR